MSEMPGIARRSAMFCSLPVIRRYSSILSRTCTVLPRLVMKTGPSCAAFCAWLAFCWNSRLDSVVMDMAQPPIEC